MSTGAMDCNELVELVTAYLDGSLDPDTRARFDLHLLGMRRLRELPAAVSSRRSRTVGKIGER